MIKRKEQFKLDDNVLARLLLDCFMLTTLVNGIRCDYSFAQNIVTRTSGERKVSYPQGSYPVYLRNENSTIYNENVLITVGFDKMLRWIFDNDVEKGDRSCSGRSLKFKLGERFVGHRKRLQFALLPIMYKMGVMTTLLTGLTVLALKGLTIGVILLIFAFGNYFTKFHKHSYQNTQPIHVHVHSQDGHNKVTSFPAYGSGPWDRGAEESNSNSYFQDSELESYRRRFTQNSPDLAKFKPLS